MPWWLWMVAGAASAALAFYVFIVVLNFLDDRAARRRLTVDVTRRDGERAVQDKVQQTISEMFNAARGGLR